MQQQWSAVDNYMISSLIPGDDVLSQVLENNKRAGLPEHDVAANQGQLLALFVRMTQARRILEIGTLGAYSSIWMARALPPDGKLITLEADPTHADVARQNIRLAGLNDRIELIEGPALNSLENFGDVPPFDLIFIDADKPNNPGYLEWALHYSRPGTVIIGDNVVRDGEVINGQSDDARVLGVRRFIEMIGDNPRLTATALQTVGVKGWDGFTLAIVER
ncbi:O-methyltransferase [Enterobacter asburiae]|uniref:O-methyltransferase n=1 Tax=Enterobacter asburiae TaxID=61645 RepID=UPI0032B02405